MPENKSDPSRTPATEPRCRPPGQQKILDGASPGGGGAGRLPFWRTPVSPVRLNQGLALVTFKINT
jgi:hypothetical protein